MTHASRTDLRDAHLHLAAHGEELSAIDLSACTSIDECLRRIAARASTIPQDGWIIARHARVESWDERAYPTAKQIDEAGGGRRAIVASFDHHAASVSTAALDSAGITSDAADPAGGVVVRDGATRRPTGVVLETAFKRVCRAMPRPTDDEARKHIRTAQRDLSGLGFVEVHDMMTSARDARLLVEMDEAGQLELGVRCYATDDEFDEVRRVLVGRTGCVRFGGMKIFTDGTLNSRTAHMLHPYADPIPVHPYGRPLMSRADIDSVFRRAIREGFDVAAHAIGDAAVRTLLDAYEAAQANDGDPGFSLRIEHAQFIDEADVPRFARLGVVASVQACHLLTDIEALLRLTPHRTDRVFPLRDLMESARDAGRDPADLILLGSDTPVVRPDPADNVQASVHRRRRDPECPVVGAAQAIGEDEAWSLMRAGPTPVG